MKLLDEPLPQLERENLRRMLDGCICRISISDDKVEVLRSAGFAVDYIMLLAYSHAKELSIRENAEQDSKT